MGPGYPFGPAAHAQLREEIGDMSFDRVHAIESWSAIS